MKKIIAFALASVVAMSSMVIPAFAGLDDALEYAGDALLQWFNPSNTQPLGGWNIVDFGSALFQSNKEQNYYTEPTESVEKDNGDVINYYRGGDTTNTKIIDSYNRTFNTIHNTTNNTNNYSANVKLNDFLNSYTTNNNDYTFSTDLKSWYYDNDTNNYNYTSNQTYYNTDNSKYYLSIDNSTDEYYLVDVQYSPTFVTVNYTYNTTNNNVTNNYGNVTNVYYYELNDGRNSYTLTESEALGIATGYDVVNYVMVPDDPDTLSLQHFDDNYVDSSAYGRLFYSENRSTSYVDSGDFNKAVKLPSGSAAGVNIPNLSTNSTLQIDFRAYFDAVASLNVLMGDVYLFGNIPQRKFSPSVYEDYTDHGQDCSFTATYDGSSISSNYITSINPAWATTTNGANITLTTKYTDTYGAFVNSFTDVVYDVITESKSVSYPDTKYRGSVSAFTGTGTKYHKRSVSASSTFNGSSVKTNFNFSNYVNQWVSFRIVLSGGYVYIFVNGDLVGSGVFSMPSADKVYIKSAGTVYLDELRVSTGSLVSTSAYNPAAAPYDTNMVLALPDTLSAMTIYARHQIAVNGWRIGGVRPSAPSTGFFYLPLHSDYTGSQPQIYDGSDWVDIDAVISPDGVAVHNVVGYLFTPDGAASDVNPELAPPDGSIGSDNSGNGGSGDSGNTGNGGTSDDDKSSLLKELFSKLFGLFDTVIGALLDGIITLATSVIERLTSVVTLFGSFGESLSLLWVWLPDEIVSVFVAGVTVLVFASVIKIFI